MSVRPTEDVLIARTWLILNSLDLGIIPRPDPIPTQKL